MRRRAGALLLAAPLLLASCDDRAGGIWDFERMIDQGRMDAYDSTSLFADGAVMRRPPAGTVAREKPRTGPVATGMIDGEPVERSPIEPTSEVLARGRDRFQIYCAVCHGERGFGQSEVARHMTLRRPPPLHGDRLRRAADGRIFAVIGGGYGLMPGYRAELPPADRWAVVAYVRALQLAAGAPFDALPPELRREFLGRVGEPEGVP